jgi:hypothetical protein
MKHGYYTYKHLLVTLYWRETWYITLKDEHKLEAFGIKVPRRIFDPKKNDEIIITIIGCTKIM